MSDNLENGAEKPQRPKLNLKPRDPNAAARLEAERLQAAAKSPFGAAKPRELVIATREGKSEEDILRDEVNKQRLQLRLNASQLEEKRAHEAAVKEIEEQVEAEEDATKKEVLRVELAAREAKLNSLLDRFAKTTLEAAMSGEAPRVSQMRKQQLEAAAAAAPAPMAPYGGGPGGGAHPGGSNYNPRYNPTQQYAGPNQRGGYQQQQQRGGFEHYNAGGRNYVPRGGRGGGGRGGGGGAGGRGGVPEWAHEEYPSRGGSGHRGGFDNSGGYRPASGGGYGDTSDAGFFDQPSGGGAPRGRGGGGGGRSGGGGGRGRGGNYYDVFNPTGYGGGGRGVGGEIDFDTFAGQDRY